MAEDKEIKYFEKLDRMIKIHSLGVPIEEPYGKVFDLTSDFLRVYKNHENGITNDEGVVTFSYFNSQGFLVFEYMKSRAYKTIKMSFLYLSFIKKLNSEIPKQLTEPGIEDIVQTMIRRMGLEIDRFQYPYEVYDVYFEDEIRFEYETIV